MFPTRSGLEQEVEQPQQDLAPDYLQCKAVVITMLDIERSVAFYCDIHGHSRKKNVFMYGCSQNNLDVNSAKANDMIRLLPYMLGGKNKIFSFKDCTFG
jgi:hypothetical protein